MPVHFKPRSFSKAPKSPKVATPTITARQLLDAAHPLHEGFIKWIKGLPPTRRQAANYLNTYPQFKGEAKAA